MPDADNNFAGSLGLDFNDDVTCNPRIKLSKMHNNNRLQNKKESSEEKEFLGHIIHNLNSKITQPFGSKTKSNITLTIMC